jgi:phosphinothricin acetyltransferase
VNIRPAAPADAEGFLAIYAPIVRDTAISFELEPPTADEFRARMTKAHLWLTAEEDGILGYAYAGIFRERPAYRFTAETTVYIHERARRRGVGRALYTELFRQLGERGFVTAVAGITLPNPSSVALHESIGFKPVGVFHKVGFKFGQWHDTGWWERAI